MAIFDKELFRKRQTMHPINANYPLSAFLVAHYSTIRPTGFAFASRARVCRAGCGSTYKTINSLCAQRHWMTMKSTVIPPTKRAPFALIHWRPVPMGCACSRKKVRRNIGRVDLCSWNEGNYVIIYAMQRDRPLILVKAFLVMVMVTHNPRRAFCMDCCTSRHQVMYKDHYVVV